MARMRVVQVREPKAPLELVEYRVPKPGPEQVRVRVEACGICQSDAIVNDSIYSGIRYPAVSGHKVAGRIDAAGPEIVLRRLGQRPGEIGLVATAPFQSTIIFSLIARPCDEITRKEGRIEQSDLNDYQMLRIAQTPVIEYASC